ncbi:hypothetical protein [Streptomyces sp. TRM49041]|uniref:hypothetical protein n=1 Tax=Streptomyces sp. TRM49041 TaxID=2603216 RepID=UPI001656864B|nr:hypothetical protein [Streptomyces sp. TRM49041]
MSVPEEDRPKTETTDDVVERGETSEQEKKTPTPQASGRTMREAVEEAGVRADDYE